MNTVLVTGGSKGIGSAIAEEFASLGYAVAINYNKSEEKAKALSLELMKKYKVPVGAYKADVRDRNEVAHVVAKIKDELGTIVILVNNAGISTQKEFSQITNEEWKAMLSTHLDGAFNCTQEVMHDMIYRQYGKIINISSMRGVTGGSCEVHYSTAKAGIIGFTKALAKELAPSNISVNAISCGVIDTAMNSCFDEEERQCLADEIPAGRFGKADEVASLSFSLANESSYLTSQVITLDGGWQ